ncbi:unnamed protein product [Arabis nemorensis]|uniref:Uncharacterized protein n=1 Tax=Arabis nemorensis TaxID=586526 RepID=A0A565CWM2_9BRAS|nr:unnamed protein product [Arabis nemorensis]
MVLVWVVALFEDIRDLDSSGLVSFSLPLSSPVVIRVTVVSSSHCPCATVWVKLLSKSELMQLMLIWRTSSASSCSVLLYQDVCVVLVLAFLDCLVFLPLYCERRNCLSPFVASS